MLLIDLAPWHVAPGEPLSANDAEIAAVLGCTPRQVAYARTRAGYPAHSRGRPARHQGSSTRRYRPEQGDPSDRAKLALALRELGRWTYARIGVALGVTKQRASILVQEGRAWDVDLEGR